MIEKKAEVQLAEKEAKKAPKDGSFKNERSVLLGNTDYTHLINGSIRIDATFHLNTICFHACWPNNYFVFALSSRGRN